MTAPEKEALISKLGYPWLELLELKQTVRNDALKRAETDDEQSKINRDYDEFLDRIIEKSGK